MNCTKAMTLAACFLVVSISGGEESSGNASSVEFRMATQIWTRAIEFGEDQRSEAAQLAIVGASMAWPIEPRLASQILLWAASQQPTIPLFDEYRTTKDDASHQFLAGLAEQLRSSGGAGAKASTLPDGEHIIRMLFSVYSHAPLSDQELIRLSLVPGREDCFLAALAFAAFPENVVALQFLTTHSDGELQKLAAARLIQKDAQNGASQFLVGMINLKKLPTEELINCLDKASEMKNWEIYLVQLPDVPKLDESNEFTWHPNANKLVARSLEINSFDSTNVHIPDRIKHLVQPGTNDSLGRPDAQRLARAAFRCGMRLISSPRASFRQLALGYDLMVSNAEIARPTFELTDKEWRDLLSSTFTIVNTAGSFIANKQSALDDLYKAIPLTEGLPLHEQHLQIMNKIKSEFKYQGIAF